MNRLYKILIVVGAAIGAGVVVALLPPVRQDPAFHRFADTREWMGVRNFGNVMSNVFYVLVGIWGFGELFGRTAPLGIRLIFGVLFF